MTKKYADLSGNRKPRATIYDVARVTGVSPSTVSRALNKPGRINVKTERRIRGAATELGYRTNPLARALHTGRTKTLALLVSDITNPVYFGFIRGAEQVMAENGLTLVLADSQESPEREREAAERLQPSVDGIMLVGSRLDDESIRTLAGGKRLVVVNRRVEGVSAVVPDVEPGLVAAIDHLSALGHNSLAFLSGPATSWMNTLRWGILFELAVERNMTIVSIGPQAPTMEGGRKLLRQVMASGVTAVMAFNDLMALGLLKHAQGEGIPVPGRLSIMGFDNIFGAQLTTPGLTTVHIPTNELGHAAVHMLTTSGVDEAVCMASVPPTLFIPRQSTGASS